MPGKAGIDGFLAFKTETTHGTYAAPTKGLEITSESLKRNNAYIKRQTIQSGVVSQRDNHHSLTTRDASGDINFDFLGNGMGSFLNLLHGNAVSPAVVVASTVFKQTHNIGLNMPNGKGMSVQVGRPDVNGTVRPFSYLGGKVGVFKLTLERGGIVTATATMDFVDEDTTQTLAVPVSDDLASSLKFQNATIEMDDVVLQDCMSSITITVTVPMATDRYCIGGGATKKEQVGNGAVSLEVDATMEFSNMAQHTAFQTAARHKLELNCEGDLIDLTNRQHLYTSIAKTVTTDAGPTIQGPDLLTQSVKLEAVQSGANPLASFEYQSADAAIA